MKIKTSAKNFVLKNRIGQELTPHLLLSHPQNEKTQIQGEKLSSFHQERTSVSLEKFPKYFFSFILIAKVMGNNLLITKSSATGKAASAIKFVNEGAYPCLSTWLWLPRQT